jgi:hypothetical protein
MAVSFEKSGDMPRVSGDPEGNGLLEPPIAYSCRLSCRCSWLAGSLLCWGDSEVCRLPRGEGTAFCGTDVLLNGFKGEIRPPGRYVPFVCDGVVPENVPEIGVPSECWYDGLRAGIAGATEKGLDILAG